MDNFILDVSDLIGKPVGSSQTYTFVNFLPYKDEDLKISKKIKGNVIFNKIEEDKLLGSFEMKSGTEISCARCNKLFKFPIQKKYDQIFSFKPGEDEFPINLNNSLDIAPSIRQEIILAIPMKPLCPRHQKENYHGST